MAKTQFLYTFSKMMNFYNIFLAIFRPSLTIHKLSLGSSELSLISSAILTFIGHRQRDRQTTRFGCNNESSIFYLFFILFRIDLLIVKSFLPPPTALLKPLSLYPLSRIALLEIKNIPLFLTLFRVKGLVYFNTQMQIPFSIYLFCKKCSRIC